MNKIKYCNECKINHPANYIISNDKGYRLICADCSKELSNILKEQTVYPDIGKKGFYEAKGFALKVNFAPKVI